MHRDDAIKQLKLTIKSLEQLPKNTPVNLLLKVHEKRRCPICQEPQGRFYVITGIHEHFEYCQKCGYRTTN